MRDHDQAAELYQRVMIRAWRGHAAFRGDSAYQTWVLRIATREAARLHAAIARHREREELRSEFLDRAVPQAPAWPGEPELLADAVDHAERAGVLSTAARLAEPSTSWLPSVIAVGGLRSPA